MKNRILDVKFLSKVYPFAVFFMKDGTYWRSDNELDATDIAFLDFILAENLKDEPVIVEIGAWTGMSTCLIGSYAKLKNGLLYTIDNFQGSPDSHQVGKYEDGYVRSTLEKNIKRFGLKNHVSILEGNSDDFLKDFPDNSIDLVFIDGDHRYTQFNKDLLGWDKKIKKGGVMSGHDFNSTIYVEEYTEKDCVHNIHHGISKGLIESNKPIMICGEKGCSVWFYRKE